MSETVEEIARGIIRDMESRGAGILVTVESYTDDIAAALAAAYARGVEDAARKVAGVYADCSQPSYSDYYQGWRDGTDIAESAVRSLFPSTPPQGQPKEGGNEAV